LKICQIVYVVVRSFFKYLVCNISNSIFKREDYPLFFKLSLTYFERGFFAYKNYFKSVHAILAKKLTRLTTEELEFQIH